MENYGIKGYWPELGEKEPDAQMRARMSVDEKHYRVDTPLTLKGRGIKYYTTYTANDLTDHGQYMVGWNSYYVTFKAFNKLEEQYTIAMPLLFD